MWFKKANRIVILEDRLSEKEFKIEDLELDMESNQKALHVLQRNRDQLLKELKELENKTAKSEKLTIVFKDNTERVIKCTRFKNDLRLKAMIIYKKNKVVANFKLEEIKGVVQS